MILPTPLRSAEQNQNLFSQKYLALMGKLWGFYCEDFGENWLCYNDTALCFFPQVDQFHCQMPCYAVP